jgi:hypothetical protein
MTEGSARFTPKITAPLWLLLEHDPNVSRVSAWHRRFRPNSASRLRRRVFWIGAIDSQSKCASFELSLVALAQEFSWRHAMSPKPFFRLLWNALLGISNEENFFRFLIWPKTIFDRTSIDAWSQIGGSENSLWQEKFEWVGSLRNPVLRIDIILV